MARLNKPVNQQDHVRGPLDALVKLVEYGDFQCPYCGAAFPILREVQRQLGDQICFAFRNFPLTEMHEYAMAAAEAAEAAAAQGKFWEMHNILYERQDELNIDHLYDFAQEIGLDMQQFEEAMADRTYEDKVHQDFMSGVRSGVNGTPTLFINRDRYDGPIELNALLKVIDRAAQTAQA